MDTQMERKNPTEDTSPREEERTRTPKHGRWLSKEAARRMERRRRMYVRILFYTLSLPFMECLLRLVDKNTTFLDLGLPRSLFAGAAVGLLLWLIGTLIPRKGISRAVIAVVLFFFGAVFIAERCCRAFFGVYYQLSYMTSMTGQVAGNFMGTALSVIGKNLWFFPLALAPFILFLIFRRTLMPRYRQLRSARPELLAAAFVALQVIAVLLCHVGDDTNYYTVDYSANSTIPRFGLVNTLRLEVQYGIFGKPEEELVFEPIETDPVETEASTAATDPEETDGTDATEQTDATDTTEPATEPDYGYNVMDIDFDSLIASDTGSLLALDQYFSSQEPTQQNAYTGIFEGKNLIFLTAESFSTAVIDEERTPILYQLANSGFVFTNYYQPNWTQSTTGGEFAAMTGIIPTWIDGQTAFSVSANKAMPFALGWQFRSLGYTVTAYHNNTYTYYGRSKTHPNLGYDYYGLGNGLELETTGTWPLSDLEMMQATIDDQIQNYLDTGTPFHTYYMTVSGHCEYGFSSNDMSEKNRDVVADLDASETVLAYLACQQELEYALEYVMDALETAGIADDTVIVLTTDHYPYAMSEGSVDYYNELTGNDDNENLTSRYRNTLILWCGEIEEPIVVDTSCSAIDIVPTLSNLFGLEYDSRLLSGRDILAPDVEAGEVASNMHVVVFADTGYGNSWITAAGTYEASTGVFTPNAGVEVSDSYVTSMNKLVQDKFTYAKYLISLDYYRHLFPDF